MSSTLLLNPKDTADEEEEEKEKVVGEENDKEEGVGEEKEKEKEEEEEKDDDNNPQIKTKKKEKSAELQLGDIIRIQALNNAYLDNQTFIIDYLDNTKINLINVKTLAPIKLRINEDHTLGDGTITAISLVFRNKESGYAKQNGLLPGTWLNIYFGGDIPTIITAEITNLEEDMIELKTYPENDTIYINFAYKGIPEDLPIETLEIRKKPEQGSNKSDDSKEGEASEEKEKEKGVPDIESDSDTYESDYARATMPVIYIKDTIREFIIRADELQFGKELEAIDQYVDVEVSQQRYNIDTQTNDLLDELLSTIPNVDRTSKVLNNVHVMIERFKQLRIDFSTFDERGNVLSAIKKDAAWKPLVNDLKKMKTSLLWLIPVAKNIKKVYDISSKEEVDSPDIVELHISEDVDNMVHVINSYESNDTPDEQNKYVSLMTEMNPYFTPYQAINPESIHDIITDISVTTDLNVIIDNLDNFYSSIVENDIIKTKRFLIQKYNLGLNRLHATQITGSKMVSQLVSLTPPDTIALKSFITLPVQAIQFSRINLPGTNILTRANLNNTFINYSKMLKKNTKITNINVDNLSDEVAFNEDTFLSEIKNYVLIKTKEIEDLKLPQTELYEKFLNSIIPKTRVLFNLVKKYIKGKLSVNEVVSMLEPFLIYNDDLTYMQYKEINEFLQEKISEYNKNFMARRKQFGRLLKSDVVAYMQPMVEYGRGNYWARFENLSTMTLPGNANTLTQMLAENEDASSIYNKYEYDATKDKSTNSELLRKMMTTDSGNLFNASVSFNSLHLMLPEGVSSIIEDEQILKSARERGSDGKENNDEEDTCNTFVIAKQYDTLEELAADNEKDIYYDKKFDTTQYNIMEEPSIQKEQMKRAPEDFRHFLIEKLRTKYTYTADESILVAEALITGLKQVQEGNYAIIHMRELDDKIHYYKRIRHRWQEDTSIDKKISTSNQDMFCNFQKNCIDVDKKYKGVACESIDINKRDLTKDALSEMVAEFDKTYQKSKEQLEKELGGNRDYYNSIIDKLGDINHNKHFKYNTAQFNLGIKNDAGEKEVDIVVSPYNKLRDMILGQSDFVKKQNDILQFATRFTREAIILPMGTVENPHWRYCIQTSVALLPTFLYTMAGSFVNEPLHYGRTTDAIIKEIGALSDDGDAWVDKNSGYVIRRIDLDVEEGYDDGYKIKSREVMEQDLGDAILNGKKVPVKAITPETKMISNVISALSEFMGLRVEDHREFMMKIVTNALPLAVPSETEYKQKVEDMAKKGKTIPPHKTIYNLSVLALTLGAFLIAVQTSIPDIKTRKTFPGCVRSFAGFPLEGAGDTSGLMYISCVAYKISRSSESIEPWTVLSKTKEQQIADKLKGFIETYYLANGDIVRKFQEKIEYLTLAPEEFIPSEHNVSKWTTFLPPLKPFKIDGLQSITPEFKKGILGDFKSASRHQREKILIIESKIIFFSLGLQEKIQNIIAKKKMILTNAANEPFMENSCCSQDNSSLSTLHYFEKEDRDIELFNHTVSELTNILIDIRAITRAPFFFCKDNTKNIYPPINDEFNEETIYRAFISMCKFNSIVPLNEELAAICTDKPEFLFGNKDISIAETIRKLKQDGRNYDNKAFIRLLQVVNRQNIVTHKASENVGGVGPVQRIRDVIDILVSKKDDIVLPELRGKLSDILDTFDLAVKEESEEMIEMKNYLGTKNDSMRETVHDFLSQYGNISKKDLKYYDELIKNVMNWEEHHEKGHISDDSLYNSINFVKNYMEYMVNTFPSIILNKGDFKSIQIPAHWAVSDKHVYDVKNLVNKYYNSMRSFYDDKYIYNIMINIQLRCKNLLLMSSETPYLTKIKYNDFLMTSIFDNRMSTLLFEHYFLTMITEYTVLADKDNMLVQESMGDNADNFAFMPSLDPSVLLGSKKNLKTRVAKILMTFLDIMYDHKRIVNFSYDKVMDAVFKSKEREKDTFTDRLEALTDDEREVDTILKINKLGAWSKGLQKGLTTYDKDTYDEERDAMEKLVQIENAIGKRTTVTDENRDQLVDDYLEEEQQDDEIDREEYNLGNLGEDYDDGDYEGYEREEE